MNEAADREPADREQHIRHAMPTEELASALDMDLKTGLGDEDVQERQQRFGANRLTPQSERITGMLCSIESVKNLRTASEDIQVEGVGYEPDGRLLIDDRDIQLEEYPTVLDMVRAGRGLLRGIGAYAQAHGPWAIFHRVATEYRAGRPPKR